jgi:adenine-specific DNA-methyltransferase
MIKKGILNQLIQTHDYISLEQHLVYSFLQSNNYDIEKSTILTNYFKDFVPNPQLYLDTSSLNISSIKELENYLELIIPISDRKFNGAFFTPDYIIDFIINEMQPKESDTNLDPSCGCGAFLVGLTEYYKRTFNKPIRKIVAENIFGSDILKYNIHRTKLILSIFGLQYGEDLCETDFNLYHQDSLRASWDQQFDNIIGNPPYVKFQDLSEENRSYLIKHWTTVDGGTFNLYFAFFELGYKLLKPTGKLGYITPNNYFTSLAGESLRRYFQQKKCVTRIIDFSHKKVFDAQTYTAITFIDKNQNEEISYDRIKDEYSPKMFLENANGSTNILNDFNAKKWRLLKSDEQQNISIIETIGTPIGKLFNICVGIATLKDEVFFINGRQRENDYYIKTTETGTFQIEKDAVKSVYKISDFKTQKEAEQNERKIIFPYQLKKGIATPIPESDFKNMFPKCYQYLLSVREILLARDKGKVKYDPFYVWGRTQGITKTGKKILNPTFSQHPRFLLIEEEDSYFTNGYGIFFKEQKSNGLFSDLTNPISKVENIDVIQKILNSIVMDYYVSKTSVAIEGGYPCYQKNFIEKFTIPELSKKEIAKIRNTNNKQEIDEYLINLYQINLPVPNLRSYIYNKSSINPS